MGMRFGGHLLLCCLWLVSVVCEPMSSSTHLADFCGKYYFNNDQSMNFVAALPFGSPDEATKMLELFHNIEEPKPRHDLPALAIMMRRPDGRLFVHDTLYNIEITPDRGDGKMAMSCWTGDMQLTLEGKVSTNQAKGKTVITLDKKIGLASMDIGGGWGAEKWVMPFRTTRRNYNGGQGLGCIQRCLVTLVIH